MTINIGDKVPAGTLHRMTADGPAAVTTDELFGGKKVVLFSVPGAFTPTCSRAHLPGFIGHADQLRAKGVDTVACMAVNDPFVMDAWGQSQHAEGKVEMLADGNGDFAQALGLDLDLTGAGLGRRGKRFSMLVEDGVVKQLNVDDEGLDKSSAETMLDQIG